MCNAGIGKGQSYWGLIQVSADTTDGMTAEKLAEFKKSLMDFMANYDSNISATLANGTTRENDLSHTTSICLQNIRAERGG